MTFCSFTHTMDEKCNPSDTAGSYLFDLPNSQDQEETIYEPLENGIYDVSQNSYTKKDVHKKDFDGEIKLLVRMFEDILLDQELEKSRGEMDNSLPSSGIQCISDSELFTMPSPLDKDTFLTISRKIQNMVLLALTPFGRPNNDSYFQSRDQFTQKYDSIYHSIVSIVSEIVYDQYHVNESIMAVSAHLYLEKLKDSESLRVMRDINEGLFRIYESSRFIEVPDMGLEEVMKLKTTLLDAIEYSIDQHANWALHSEVDKVCSNDFMNTFYPSVLYSLGYLPVRSPCSKESPLRQKALTAAIVKPIMSVLKNNSIKAEQFWALLDCYTIDKDDDRIYPWNLMNINGPSAPHSTCCDEQDVKGSISDGESFLQIGNFTQALLSYELVLSKLPPYCPSIVPILISKAKCYQQTDQLDLAIEECTLAIHLAPEEVEAYVIRAQILESQEDYEKALHDMVTAYVVGGSICESYRNDIERLSKYQGRFLGKIIYNSRHWRPEGLPSTWLIDSYMSSFRKDVDYNIRFKEDVSHHTHVKKIFFEALSLKRSKHYQDSMLCCEKILDSVDLEPCFNAILYNLYGTYVYLTGNLEVAINMISKSLEFDSECVNTLIKFATMLYENGNFEKSSEYFDMAEDLDPNNSDLFLHRGQLKFLEGDFRGAMYDLQRSLNIFDQMAVTQVTYAMVLYKLGSLNDAMTCFEKTADLFPDQPDVWLFFGEILSDRGDYVKAMECFSKAVSLFDNCPLPYLNAGRAFMTTQDAKRAIQHFEKALDIDSKCSPAHLDVAQLYFAQGRTIEAFEHFEKAIKYARFLPEIEDIVAAREVAKIQVDLVRELGVDLRYLMCK